MKKSFLQEQINSIRGELSFLKGGLNNRIEENLELKKKLHNHIKPFKFKIGEKVIYRRDNKKYTVLDCYVSDDINNIVHATIDGEKEIMIIPPNSITDREEMFDLSFT